MTRRFPRPATAALACLLTVLPACSQGAREDQAERVRRSVPRAIGATVSGTLALDLRPKAVDPTRAVNVRGALRLGRVTFVADPGGHRAAFATGQSDPPVFVSSGRTLFARRTTRSARERRPWVRVELDRIDDVEVPTFAQVAERAGPGDATVVDPRLMIDLLAGVLTGSLERGPAADGTSTYRFNVSVDRADRALRRPEDERKDRRNVLRSLAITGDVHPGEAELRADGSLARLRIRFEERPDKQAVLVLTAELVTDPGPATRPLEPTPAREATIRVSSLAEVRGAVADRLGAPT